MNILYPFTRALSSGITLAKVNARSLLPNLYVINRNDDADIPLIYSGNFPNIYPQAYNEYLDRLGFSFGVERLPNEEDFDYRERILFSLRRNATMGSIKSNLELLLNYIGLEAKVDVIENSKNFFDAETSTLDFPLRDPHGSMFYYLTIAVRPGEINSSGLKKPVYKTYFEDIFRVNNFKNILEDIVAAGIKVDSVVFLAPGAGGEKGDFYVNKN
mgnify:CR=1 FL=1